MKHSESFIKFEFTALNFRNSQKNQYAYMMEGFDKDFNYTNSDNRSATYTHLDPGHYIFRVKASNNDGLWNEEGKSIEIIVSPAWWETHWFRGIISLLAIGFIFGVVRLKTHSIQKVNRRLEIQVAERTRELKTWLENSPVCTKIVDLNFNLQYMSSAGIKGIKIEDITKYYGKPYPFNFYPESFKKQMNKNLAKVRATGEVITQDGAVVDLKGNELWYQSTLVPVNGDSGKLDYIIIVSEDITDRILADAALKKAHTDLEKKVQQRTAELTKEIIERKQLELRFQQLAENSTDWIWEFDENNMFTYSSSGVTELLGYSPEEVIGIPVFDLIPSQEKEKVAKEFAKSKDNHKPFTSLQNINLHKDGHLVTIESSGSPIFNSDGEFKGYRGIDRDISQRKRMEEELRQSHKMESIGTIAGGIAHDFNNILGIIVGNAELAMESLPVWNPSFNNIKEIKTASLRARDVVSQLLSFSRKTELEKKPVDITMVIKESINLIRASIPSNIEIRQDVPETVDTILADATQIHQVLINLCTNASHAMADDGGLLEIILRSKMLEEKSDEINKGLLPGNYIELIVKDSGSGIDPDTHGKIFDPYFTTKEVGKGTGMGLSVVHGIVTNHNGGIFVNSKPGKGSIFTILFPTILEKPQLEIKKRPSKISPSGKETILFVDDEEALVNMSKMILEKFGYTIHTSTNPLKALAIFKADPDRFDLVISDMTMPRMSGVKLSEELRKIQSDIPIIICTGHSSLLNEEKAKDIDISAFAMKPIAMSEIAKLIRTVLDE